VLPENKLLIASAILVFKLGGLAKSSYLGVRSTQPAPPPAESAPIKNSAIDFLNHGVDKAERGNFRGAIADFNQAIKLNPNWSAAYYNRALAHYDLGDKQAAIADFNQTIKLNPNDANAYVNLGSARYDLGDKQAAIADFNQAIKLNPNLADAYDNRGVAYFNLGNKQAAIEDYQKAAVLYQRQGKLDDYKRTLNQLRKLQSGV